MRLSGLRNRKHNASSFHTILLLIVPKLFKKGWNIDLAILSLLSLGKARTYLWNTVPRVQKPQKVKSSRTKCLMMAYTPIYIVLLLLILSKWSMFYMNKCIYYISSPFSLSSLKNFWFLPFMLITYVSEDNCISHLWTQQTHIFQCFMITMFSRLILSNFHCSCLDIIPCTSFLKRYAQSRQSISGEGVLLLID